MPQKRSVNRIAKRIRNPEIPAEIRVLVRTRRTASGCWETTGGINNSGYAIVTDPTRGRSVLGHRALYEAIHGPVPKGFELDHLCRNRPCVNPAHLEVVTHKENARRSPILGQWLKVHPVGGWSGNGLKTHCKQGHEFTPENTRRYGRTHRACRACARKWSREYYRRRTVMTELIKLAAPATARSIAAEERMLAEEVKG